MGIHLEINGEEVSVTFDGDNVIVNGEAVPVSETVGGDAPGAVVEGGSVDVNGEDVAVIFDGSTAIVNGEVVPVSDEETTVMIDGEEVSVTFDGDNVIVNGDSVAEAVPADSVLNGESYSQAILSLSDNVANNLQDLVAA